MTAQEAVDKFKRIKRGAIYLIHQKSLQDPTEDYTLCDMAISALEKQLPSAQPEIIHCEECMYRNNTDTSVRWLPCMEVATGDYWFCGSGKRSERREE